MNQKAYIIGNGTTRKTFDLRMFKEEHETIGCNAIYREMTPKYIVSIDNVILKELMNSPFPNERIIVPKEQREPAEFNEFRPRENSGMLAMRHVISMGKKELWCIGMDFLVDDYDVNLGNIFDGTNGYGKETRATFRDTQNRCKYFDWFASKNPEVKFNMCFPVGSRSFREIKSKNVFGHTFLELIKNLNN